MIRSAAAVYLHSTVATNAPDRVISWLGCASLRIGGFRRSRVLTPVAPTRAAFFLAAATLLLAPAIAFAQPDFGTQTLGVPSSVQTVNVVLSAPGIVGNVRVLTSGAPGLDFVSAGASTCVSTSFPGNCGVSVTFTPSAPGLRVGAIVLMDADQQTVLGTTFIHGIGSGGVGVLIPGNIVPFAGDGEGKSVPVLDGIPAPMAELDQPSSVALDGLGNLYIADVYHHRIRMVCGGLGATIGGTACSAAQAGIISTIAGNGTPSFTGDGGLAASATLDTPAGVALDGAGNLYIADSVNNVIRKITAATGVITTVVGFKNAEGSGASGFGGDGGPATAALLNTPWGLTVDEFGYMYIADTFNHRIRKVNIEANAIGTAAGTGIPGYNFDNVQANTAELNVPYAVAFDAAHNMYIPDSANNRVRMVNESGIISTLAGVGTIGFSGDGAAASAAELWSPSGVAADAAGNVYIADTQNSAIRKVSASGIIITVAQNDVGVYLYNGGGPYPVSLYWPWGMALDGQGNLYFADFLNLRVSEIQGNVSPVDFTQTPIRQGYQSNPAKIPSELENDGNAPLDLVSIVAGADAVLQQSALDPTLAPCAATGQSLAPDADCWIDPVFAPAATPPLTANATETGDINIAANSTSSLASTNSPLQVEVVGIATPVNSTTTTLASNPNPSGFGQNVTFTATITTGAGSGDLTGGVDFYYGTTLIAPTVPVAQAATAGQWVAAATISTLAVGTHTITAVYDNTKDPDHFSSSVTLTQVVLEGTVTALTASEKTATIGDTVLFTAAVATANGGAYPLDGSVTFTNGATILCAQSINATGIATCSTSALTLGLNQIVATYTPASTAEIQPSIGLLTLDVQAGSSIQVALGGIQAQANSTMFYGNPVTIVATVTAGGTSASSTGSSTAPATGTVTFLDGAQQIGTGALAGAQGQAQASFATSALAVGVHSITASYAGDANYKPSVSGPISITISQAQTAVAVSAFPATAIAGAPVALSAAIAVTQGVATPTGTVTFTGGGIAIGSQAAAAGPAIISPIFAPGVQSIVATYSGDTDSSGSVSAPLSLQILIATTTAAVTSSADPSIVLSSVTFSAKVAGNGGIPTGTVTFTADGTALGTASLDATGSASLSNSALAVGSHSITVSYSGDANNAPAISPAITQVVGAISTATALGESSTGSTTPGVLLVATVVGATGPPPTGTVTFLVGATVLGAAQLNASGVASLAPNPFSGTETVTASYGGDTIHGTSVSPPIQVTGVPVGFLITVTPSTLSIPAGQSATVSVALTSINGFTDTIGLGCATLPAVVNCHFSAVSVPLVANATQTVQLTLDTNNPLGGGTSTSRNTPLRAGNVRLAGLSLPIAAFFGMVFWRLRRRNRVFLRALPLLFLAGGALLLNGCGGFSQIDAAVGVYTIQVTGTGVNSDIVHYQNVALTVTQ
jgi:large repetitive protein